MPGACKENKRNNARQKLLLLLWAISSEGTADKAREHSGLCKANIIEAKRCIEERSISAFRRQA